MKKTILTAALSLFIGLTAVFANNEKNASAQQVVSFKKEFAAAKEITWQKQDGYSTANFVLNGQAMTAYYSDRAELLAVVRHILSDRLPFYLQADLKKNYNDYWITELFESASNNSSHYRIKLENKNESIVMVSANATDWSIEKRNKKG